VQQIAFTIYLFLASKIVCKLQEITLGHKKVRFFKINFVSPKAAAACCIKKLPQKCPGPILQKPHEITIYRRKRQFVAALKKSPRSKPAFFLRKTHEIMLRNDIVRFFDQLCTAGSANSLLH